MNNSGGDAEIAETQTDFPFSSKEPEIYSAEMINTNQGKEEKTLIARSGARFFSRTGQDALLQTEANKRFIINFSRKIYVENVEKLPAKSDNSGDTLNDFLTTEWLNQKTDTIFEKLSTENGLSRFRASFENSESLIFVDENYKMPVRQEFYSVDGERKTLIYSIELRNFKLAADESLFEIPEDFRKVSAAEFKKNE